MDNEENKMQELALQLLQIDTDSLQGVRALIDVILALKQGRTEGGEIDKGGSSDPVELP